MEPAHFGEREATTDRGMSVAGNLRAGPLPDIGLLDAPPTGSVHPAPPSTSRRPWPSDAPSSTT